MPFKKSNVIWKRQTSNTDPYYNHGGDYVGRAEEEKSYPDYDRGILQL